MSHGQSQFEFYSALDLDRPQVPDRSRVQLELLKERLVSVGQSCRVLDLGCGDGRQARFARTAAPLEHIVGMDWTFAGLGRAMADGLPVVQGAIDGHNLPFRSDSFDIVVFSEVIEHLVDTDHVVAEIGRVLTTNGTLLISTPNLAAWFNRGLLLFGVQPVFSEVSRLRVFGRPGQQVAGHLRLFTLRALRELLESQGFVVERTRGAAYHGLPRGGRWLDRRLRRRPSLAAVLVVSARNAGVGP